MTNDELRKHCEAILAAARPQHPVPSRDPESSAVLCLHPVLVDGVCEKCEERVTLLDPADCTHEGARDGFCPACGAEGDEGAAYRSMDESVPRLGRW